MDSVINWHDKVFETSEDLRELNKIIAQRLSPESLVFVEVEIDGKIQVHSHSFDKNTTWFVVPDYSTDTDAALRLVRNLPQGHIFMLILKTNGRYKAVIQCRYDATKDKVDKAETAALAICKTWLAWTD